ncbi:MAG TPA: DUF1707 domain-containing protein, partial [Micromonosporaceae bacterium]|nr:DUF1707 domain-containing protein [Micromonosporaceae bacterium]
RALNEGRLNLAEYDERVRAAYAAGAAAELATLVADLADPPRPPRRGIIDAAFDYCVVNSALLPSPRREILKWSWVAGTAAILLIWFSLRMPLIVAVHPVLLLMLLWPVKSVVARLGRTARDRQAALLKEIRTALKAHPDVTYVQIEYDPLNEVKILAEVRDGHHGCGVAKPGGPPRVPSFVKKAVRLLWLSRLYPISKISFKLSHGWGDDRIVHNHKIRLNRAATRELSDRYGPRPYGPLRS